MARSQFAESQVLLSGTKTAVQEKVDQGTAYGASSSTANDLGVGLNGKYGQVTYAAYASNGTTAKVLYTFASTGVSSKLTSKTVLYTYTPPTSGATSSNGTWACTTNVETSIAGTCSHVESAPTL
nr:pilin [uncultured Acinetobacter sp.]